MFNTSVDDLHTVSRLLDQVGYNGADRREGAACNRVAEYLRYVAEQREEYEARKRAERRQQRYPSLGRATQAIWRAKAAAGALAEG